ncbi:MAG: hypothetical protein LLG04_13990 [Parachlamydia sp.]|nr:hypothetical protein [Parachlamydia sp.]
MLPVQPVAPALASQPAQSSFISQLHKLVIETIQHSQTFPGYSDEIFAKLKPGLIQDWNELMQKGELLVSRTDKEVRPNFVTLQAIVEQVLSQNLNKEIVSLTGVIHTPQPATPLCTKEDMLSPELVAPSIAQDPARLATVKGRTTIVRDFLRRGGNLYVAYPEKGLLERKPDQQAIYKNELQIFHEHLHDHPLKIDEIPVELHGALYFFTSKDGENLVFAIKMTQAKNPEETGHFGLWMGPASHPAVKKRTEHVMDFVQRHSETPIPLGTQKLM